MLTSGQGNPETDAAKLVARIHVVAAPRWAPSPRQLWPTAQCPQHLWVLRLAGTPLRMNQRFMLIINSLPLFSG